MTLVHASVSRTNDSTLNRRRVGEPKTSCRVAKNIHSEEMELTPVDKVPRCRVFSGRKCCPTIQVSRNPKGQKAAVVIPEAWGWGGGGLWGGGEKE